MTSSARQAAVRPCEPSSLVPLSRSFYARPVLTVARDCLGKLLVHRIESDILVGRIVETEAYRGPEDQAAHSYRGRRTPRTEVMFGPAGFAYLFFVYGMHWQFNVVTGQPEQPQAVLVRAVEPVSGIEQMAARRNMGGTRRNLTNGPGKVCSAFGLGAEQYGMDLCRGPLFLADAPRARAARSERVGVDYAGVWAKKPWRFFEPDNPYVSRARRGRVGS